MSATVKERQALRTLLDELAEEYTLPELLPDDVTGSRLAEVTGKRYNSCCRWLNQKVTSGELVAVLCNATAKDGHRFRVTAYRKAEK